jgi:hypothetical protein
MLYMQAWTDRKRWAEPWLLKRCILRSRAPEIHPCSANADHHLVQMPARRWVHPRAAKRLCSANAKFERPAADRLMADVDTAFSQQIVDIAKAHREAEIEPHHMSNHNSRKSVTGVRDWFHRVRATPPSYRRRGEISKPTVNLTTPGPEIYCCIDSTKCYYMLYLIHLVPAPSNRHGLPRQQ